MSQHTYSAKILDALTHEPTGKFNFSIQPDNTRNAARCLTAVLCSRLEASEEEPKLKTNTTYGWAGGVINIRNAVRPQKSLWTNVRLTTAEQLHSKATDVDVVYLMCRWGPSDTHAQVWAIPEAIVYDAVNRLPKGANDENQRSVEIFPDVQRIKNDPTPVDLTPFYKRIKLRENELNRLVEVSNADLNLRKSRKDNDDVEPEPTPPIEPLPPIESDGEEIVRKGTPGFTDATVEFLLELPLRVEDADWHSKNKQRYRTVLQEPCNSLVKMLREGYIERLNPAVAGGTRPLSILKKNDFGKGGYQDHFWFAFYDPKAGSKTKSVQLFFRMLGLEKKWRYGFSMGNYCDEYVANLQTAISNNRESVAAFLEKAGADTHVGVVAGSDEKRFSPTEFASCLRNKKDAENYGFDKPITNIEVVREFDLSTLPEHDDRLVNEVGSYFEWTWPLFQASMDRTWPKIFPIMTDKARDADVVEPEEDVPASLEELSMETALSVHFLKQMQDALLAKQQAILVGPPGTSKTYIAIQFARYFVRQRKDHSQGRSQPLYMHANWSYEDFFEGLKPANKEGQLSFEPKKGFFLDWVEKLKEVDPSARHVLVLDEINRCDTAAVLGELLQLLEHRGRTVTLLSGTQFVLPKNLFIIGTMNSADRSIGRMDLALRRRFCWLKLYPDAGALKTWLDRSQNNQVKFSADTLTECNKVLSVHGIPKEQHIGHALFMTRKSDSDDDTSFGKDQPLTERHLRQIVTFSVLPYVEELFLTQTGKVDDGVVQSINDLLLSCLKEPISESNQVTEDASI